MNRDNIEEDLRRITKELEHLLEMVHEDYSNERAYAMCQYNMGLMVGIGYAKRELEKMISSSDNP
ncbi:hypothetical protein [Robertmurraya sp.]|uniref:hypothetical protein n=1 Tax=Robertmurraya sp. TaxID=2837525 RepID=UPI0037040C35